MAFASALAMLALIGVAAYRATNGLVNSEQQVSHTREVQTVLEDIDSDVVAATEARLGYVAAGEDAERGVYEANAQALPPKLDRLRLLTTDNHSQQTRVEDLSKLIDAELTTLKQSIELRRSHRPDVPEQLELTRASRARVSRIMGLINQMKREEEEVLAQRRGESARVYRRTVAFLTGAFVLITLLLLANFYRLNLELKQREWAEQVAREGEQLITAFFSSSTVGFAILDSNLRYQRINQVLAQIAGGRPENFAGQTVAELSGDHTVHNPALLREVIATGKPVLDHAIMQAVPGKPTEARQWVVNYFPIRGSRGEVSKLGIIALDVTARKAAEAAYRHLSSRLLHLQDEERRRIAREMHDSLGQYLTALKINLELFAEASQEKQSELLSESLQLAQECLTETRTLSHLLHPPLLDEAGFASAARWYVNGFAERSGIEVKLNLPDDLRRLPLQIETALFRVLQEALTNIHRHSQSASADIQLQVEATRASLLIRDYGRGIPPTLLQRFYRDGTQTGVGLAGMRERIYELGGRLEISSPGPGTAVSATIPLSAPQSLPGQAAERKSSSAA